MWLPADVLATSPREQGVESFQKKGYPAAAAAAASASQQASRPRE